MTSLGAPIAEGRTAEVYAWREGTVLKLYRDWAPRRWLDEELRVARIVHAAGLASPAPGEIVEVNGRSGLVYERLDGPSMLAAMQRRWFLTARHCAQQMASLHVAMHRCQAPDLPRCRERLAHSIEHAPDLPDALRTAVLRQLEDLPDADNLCHGDFHPGNILMTERGPIIIDWMTAVRGHPLADVARSVVLVTAGRPPGRLASMVFSVVSSGFCRTYLRHYSTYLPAPRPLLGAWLSVVAAARLSERIEGERAALLTMVTKGLRDTAASYE